MRRENFYLSIAFVLMAHYYFLFSFLFMNRPLKKIKNKPDIHIVKIKFKNDPNQNRRIIKKSKLNLSDLAIDQSILKEDKSIVRFGKFGDNEKTNQGSLYTNIYQLIAQGLSYPEKFQKSKLQGVVKGRLVFNSQGNYIEKFSKLNSNSNFLRVYTWRTIAKVFKNPLRFKISNLSEKYFSIDLQIIFTLDKALDKKYIESTSFINGNLLSIVLSGINTPSIVQMHSGPETFGAASAKSISVDFIPLLSPLLNSKDNNRKDLEDLKNDSSW